MAEVFVRRRGRRRRRSFVVRLRFAGRRKGVPEYLMLVG
jgi:hypothetical protein